MNGVIGGRVARAVGRKVRKSIELEGWVSTIARCASWPAVYTRRKLRELTPRRRRFRRLGRRFDREFGVDTERDLDPGWLADIESPNWAWGAGYEPVDVEALRTRLDALDAQLGDFTFIDFGSGKGRSLLVAAEYPFRRIVGVEYSRDLHAAARRNLGRYRNPRQRCFDIRAELGDAVEFPVPEDPCILLFNHPFNEPVFREVIERIVESHEKAPRRSIVLYFDPRCAHLFVTPPFRAIERADDYAIFEIEATGGARGDDGDAG